MTNVPFHSALSPKHQRLMELIEAENARSKAVGILERHILIKLFQRT